MSKGPHVPLTREAFANCLSWKKVDTPLIPFTTIWEKAMRRRGELLEDGRKQIVIIAVWAKGLQNVYNAREVAEMLGNDNGNINKWNHNDEYLIYGGIPANDYRLLAMFVGKKGAASHVRCTWT